MARLAREDGVTVFLTTQYLEEADVLANRVGIIDHGRLVAEGTPAALKAQVGGSSVEAAPADPAELGALADLLERFGERNESAADLVSVRFTAAADLTAVVRALDAAGIKVSSLAVRDPSLDDVFLEKTGRSLEGAGAEAEEDPEGAGPSERELAGSRG